MEVDRRQDIGDVRSSHVELGEQFDLPPGNARIHAV
jgi:hypothetical protein